MAKWTVEHDGPSLPIIMCGSEVIALVRAQNAEVAAAKIAAAPEMYDALEAVLNWIDSGDAPWFAGARCREDEIRAALAKARGETA